MNKQLPLSVAAAITLGLAVDSLYGGRTRSHSNVNSNKDRKVNPDKKKKRKASKKAKRKNRKK